MRSNVCRCVFLILMYLVTVSLEEGVQERQDTTLGALLHNKTELSTSHGGRLFVQIKAAKFQAPSPLVGNHQRKYQQNQHQTNTELYAIETQKDFYIECEVNSQLDVEPLIYWWFRASSTSNGTTPRADSQSQPLQIDSIRILKRPPTLTHTAWRRSASSYPSSSSSLPPPAAASDAVEQHKRNKITVVSRIYVDCPSSENEGTYFCAAMVNDVYQKSQVKLKVLVPEKRMKKPESINRMVKKSSCELAPYKPTGPNTARIIEYTLVVFSTEFDDITLRCRTQNWKLKQLNLFAAAHIQQAAKQRRRGNSSRRKRNEALSSSSTAKMDSMNLMSVIWLDNRNEQIKETSDMFQLWPNGDLSIRNLTYEQHFGQFACITRNGNRIDSVSTFIFPMRSDASVAGSRRR